MCLLPPALGTRGREPNNPRRLPSASLIPVFVYTLGLCSTSFPPAFGIFRLVTLSICLRLLPLWPACFGRVRHRHRKLLGDSDTLASRNISDGAVIHLFQRPKLSAFATPAAGGGAVSAQHPGRLHEIPPLLLQVQERGSSNLQAQGYLDTHWEIDVPRRGVRFLASFLLLISVMQVTPVRNVGCAHEIDAVAED